MKMAPVARRAVCGVPLFQFLQQLLKKCRRWRAPDNVCLAVPGAKQQCGYRVEAAALEQGEVRIQPAQRFLARRRLFLDTAEAAGLLREAALVAVERLGRILGFE